MPTPTLDFQALFDASPNLYLVLDRALHIVGANKAYLAATQRPLNELVGRWAWDAFPTDPQTLRLSIDSFERVIRTGRSDTMPLLRFDIPRPLAEGGGMDKRYWSIIHSPVANAAGEVEFVLQHAIDVTELEGLREARQPDAPRGPKQEQGGLAERVRRVHAVNCQLRAEAERLRELFAQAPPFMAMLRGPEHRFELTNRSFQMLIGERDVIGRTAREAVPELVQVQLFETLDRAFATGEAFIGHQVEVTLQHRRGQPSEKRVVDFIYQPIRGVDGSVSGIFIAGNDVTEATRALEELQRSEAQLRLVIQGAKDHAILTLDAGGTITSWSDGAVAIFGWSAQEAIGQPVSLIFTAEDRAAGIDRLELDTAATQASASDQRWHATKDGRKVFMNGSLYALPPDEQGQSRGYLKIARDETARRAGHEALAASERRFRLMADAVPQIIWVVGRGGEVEFLNRQWSTYTGSPLPATVAELIGRHLHPDDAAGSLAAFEAATRQGTSYRAEHRVRSAAGEWRWFSVHGEPVVDPATGTIAHWVGASVDINDRKIASDALERTAQWQAYVVRLGDLIGGLADPGAIQRAALALVAQCLGTARALYGEYETERGFVREEFKRDDLPPIAGEYAMDAFPVLHGWMREGREVVLPDIAASDEFGPDERTGLTSLNFGSMMAFPRVKGGRLVASLVVGCEGPRAWTELDVTLGRETAERTWAAVERSRAEAALRQADRRKDEFLATLAHELRNPMAPLRTGIQLARLALPADSRLHKTMAMMDRQMTHLVRLVDDLLDVGRITSGKLVLTRVPIGLGPVLAASIESVQSLMEARGHRLAQQGDAGELRVLGDFDRLAQVFINLLTNAAKYTPPGGHITLSLERRPPWAIVRVTDDGIGIAQESLDHVFDLFSQVNSHPHKSEGGLGIGLSLVRSIVNLHEGTVAVRSAGRGKGSTFEVRLPLLA